MEGENIRMTDLRQLQRDTQNIRGANGHGSYCECIWCVDGDTQLVKSSDLAKQEIEQAMTAMLQDLPLSISIAKQGDLDSDEYTWQCMGMTGKAGSVVDATREALQSLIKTFAVSQAN